jgi:hypothetical protein
MMMVATVMAVDLHLHSSYRPRAGLVKDFFDRSPSRSAEAAPAEFCSPRRSFHEHGPPHYAGACCCAAAGEACSSSTIRW